MLPVMTDRSLTVTLPEPDADGVTARVASGAYASESDVVRAGLRALEALEDEAEGWIAGEGAARYDAWKADPSRARPAAEAFARVRDAIRQV